MTESATTTTSDSHAVTTGSARLTPRLRLILLLVILADVLDRHRLRELADLGDSLRVAVLQGW